MKRLFFCVFILLFLSCDKEDDGGNPNCNTPGQITLEEINSSSVLFSWETNEETAWQIEYGFKGFDLGNGTVVATSQTDYFLEGLQPLTAYTLQIRANCGSNGFSEYRSIDFETLMSTNACNTPTDLFVSDVSETSFGIGWQENGESAWQVEYGLVGFTIGNGTIIDTSQSTVTISGLMPNTNYEVYVRANCGSQGFSEDSDAVVVTTD